MDELLSQQMADAGFEVISTYTDAQAVEDGVLVDVTLMTLPWTTFGARRITRVTRAVWSMAEREAARRLSRERGALFTVESDEVSDSVIAPVVSEMAQVALRTFDRGWYLGEWNGEPLWLLPNEMGGYTLMTPEDY